MSIRILNITQKQNIVSYRRVRRLSRGGWSARPILTTWLADPSCSVGLREKAMERSVAITERWKDRSGEPQEGANPRGGWIHADIVFAASEPHTPSIRGLF